MPGIVGIISKAPREVVMPTLLDMLGTLHHESFYGSGTWVDEELGVYVGWASRDGSACAGMPLYNEKKDVVLVFSGQDYSDPNAARQLKEKGHDFGNDGVSYLVHLAEEDLLFPVSLNGQFQGIVVDRKRRTATLFNDRYGMHRLYYYESKDAFYFAAEAKAIAAVRPEARSFDAKSLGEFVSCGCVLEDRTVFTGVRALPGASKWTFRDGTVEQRQTYFDPQEWEEQTAVDDEQFYQELRHVLSQNLPRYFNGQERVGVALTGGLDTRLIMAWNPMGAGAVPCYTFGGMLRESQDVLIARRVAQACKQPHQVIEVGQEFLGRFDYYAERAMYLGEGGVDVSRASDVYVSELAREIAPAKVVGTYGSEILRQVVTFKPARTLPTWLNGDCAAQAQRAGETYARIRRQHPTTFAAFRQSPWHHYGVLALEQSQLTVRSPYLDNDFVKTVFRAPRRDQHSKDVRMRLVCGASPSLAGIRTDRGLMPRAAGASWAGARGLLEFAFKAEYAYDYGMPGWLAQTDHLLSPLGLHRLFLGRHKLLHYRIWYRDILAEYIRQVLLDGLALSRPYINRREVETIVNGHLRGGQNHTTQIHKLLALELLHRLFFDPK